LTALETVAADTPAASATSLMVGRRPMNEHDINVEKDFEKDFENV